MDSIKVTELRAENIKRVKAVQLSPAPTGLTVIGGNNNQGKTSVLDAIAWALGGDRFRPSQPQRVGSVIPPNIRVTLSNGLVVERSGKNGSLKVIDPQGNKGGQQLLNSFVEQLALDLPRFLNATAKEKAGILLKIVGIGDQLFTLDRKEQELYNERLAIGRIAAQKAAAAKELPHWDGVPEEPVSAAELIRWQQDILAKNGENARLRRNRDVLKMDLDMLRHQLADLTKKVSDLEEQYATACRDAADLEDESTEELEESIRGVDETNAKVRQNLARAQAEKEAKDCQDQYDGLTCQIEILRKERLELLNGADMPLPGLSVERGELTYRGQPWDNMSASEQLRVATAIVRRLNPACGFVLLDKLEQMDLDTLRDFGEWLREEGLQAIATRVSTGPECSIIITDGTAELSEDASQCTWKPGVF